jgi:hypothetical protein
VRPSLPELTGCCAPFLSKLVSPNRRDVSLFNFVGMKYLPQSVARGALKQFFDRRTVRSHRGEKRLDAFRIRLCHCGKRIQAQQQPVGFLFADVEDVHRHFHVGRRINVQMVVDQRQSSVR